MKSDSSSIVGVSSTTIVRWPRAGKYNYRRNRRAMYSIASSVQHTLTMTTSSRHCNRRISVLFPAPRGINPLMQPSTASHLTMPRPATIAHLHTQSTYATPEKRTKRCSDTRTLKTKHDPAGNVNQTRANVCGSQCPKAVSAAHQTTR